MSLVRLTESDRKSSRDAVTVSRCLSIVCGCFDTLVQKQFKQNRPLAPVQYALSAIISGLNGDYAGRSQIAGIYEVFPLLCPMCCAQCAVAKCA